MGYEERTYRRLYREKDLLHFQVVVGETDLDIAVKKERYSENLHRLTEEHVCALRREMSAYLERDSEFLTALAPHQPLAEAPLPLRQMCEMARIAGVGPMAAVAGMFAEQIGKFLSRYSTEVIVENGGDIWLKTNRIRRAAVFAGDSPFSQRIALEIDPSHTPAGICTSSATVGHSLSFGKADAVVILSPSAVLADAVATAACNRVQDTKDLETAVRWALGIPGISGALAIMGDKMSAAGKVKLIPV